MIEAVSKESAKISLRNVCSNPKISQLGYRFENLENETVEKLITGVSKKTEGQVGLVWGGHAWIKDSNRNI